MKTLTLAALGLAAALAAPMASADTVVRTINGGLVVLQNDHHVVHAPRVVVLPRHYSTVRVLNVGHRESPAQQLIELVRDMNHPRYALYPYVGYVTH